MKKLLHKFNTSKSAKWFLLGGVVIIAAVIVLLVFAPWNSQPAPPEETPVIQETPPPAETPEETPPPTEAPEETPEPTPPPPPANPLTGELLNVAGDVWTEDMMRSRPWAVAIGNTNFGVDLRGVGDADIICEYMNYSSGETRIMAIYQEVEHVEYIRGIRSLRTGSQEIAASFDAIFATWGGLTYSGRQVYGNPITPLDTFDASWVGGRMDEDILSGARNLENRAYVTGAGLVGGLPDSFRATHEDSFSQGFIFKEDGTPEGGTPAEKVTVSFATWSTKTTEFEYNEADGLYYVSQYGREFKDLNHEEQISFTNVIVMKMNMRRNYNAAGHVYIDTTTDGRTAYYINGGQCVEIMYKRETLDDPYTYYLPDGTPLEMGIGKTYICTVENTDGFDPLSFEELGIRN